MKQEAPLGPDQQAGSDNLEVRADCLFAAGQLPEAALLYRKILQREPGRLDVQSRLGRLALLENDPQQAITQLAGVLNSGLRTKANWEALADAYLANGESGPAALCYERAGRSGLAGTLAVMADREPCRIAGAVDAIELHWLAQADLPIIQAEVNGILGSGVLLRSTSCIHAVVQSLHLCIPARQRWGMQKDCRNNPCRLEHKPAYPNRNVIFGQIFFSAALTFDHQISTMAVTPTGKRLVIGDQSGRLHLLSLQI